MERKVRCEAVILKDNCILVLKHINHRSGQSYWWLPGGGLEAGETQEACVVREVKEETGLDVRVERLLFEVEDEERRYTYQRYATYLCLVVSGEAKPGHEHESSLVHSITGLDWFPLWNKTRWEEGLYDEHIYPLLLAIQAALKQAHE